MPALQLQVAAQDRSAQALPQVPQLPLANTEADRTIGPAASTGVKMDIREITTQGERATFEVHSDSGNLYHVIYIGSGDDAHGIVRIWECSCPAGQHGKICKHIDAVIARVDQDDDEDSALARLAAQIQGFLPVD